MSEIDTHPSSAPEPVVLIIADISGYTRFMTANAKTLAHSQTIITELVKTIVRQIELPLEVAKLEGDAVFLFGRKERDLQSWNKAREIIGQKLLTFFEVFRAKIDELSYSTTCTCNACSQIEKLRLKLVVHSGEALFHRVYDFQELAGVDVIILHRLLKNSVRADQYLLMTEAARRDVALPQTIKLIPASETYEDIGRIPVGIYYPEKATVPPENPAPNTTSVSSRFRVAARLFLKLWFKPVQFLTGSEKTIFKNLNSETGSFQRYTFALITILLTPIYLPIGLVGVLLRAAHPPATHLRASPHPHVHLADGSCCSKDLH
jgi:hypothetical protein